MRKLPLLLLLLISCAELRGQSNWFQFTLPWDDSSRTAIDASDLLVDYPGQDPSTVIDARGFVRAGADGHFYFEKTGKRARFWGVNFVFNANFPPCPDEPLRSGEYQDQRVSEKVARRLAKLGVNVVRFHHMDSTESPNGIFDRAYWPNDTQHLDAGQLKRLDYLIYQLRKNGIYVNLNLKVSRRFGPGDGLADTQLFTDNLRYFQGVSHYNARMIELQEDYARQLLTHRNPYTGKSYAEDPAVLCVEIANEDSMFGNFRNDGGLNYSAEIANSLPKRYSNELDTLWNDWLRARYKTQQDLASAWEYTGAPADTSDRMRNGGFENGMTDWTVQRLESAQMTARIESGSGPDGSAALRVDVTSDSTDWHVQAFQNGHAIEKNQLYEIRFYAKASATGDIRLDVMKGAPPWQNYGLSKAFQLSTVWTKYSASFRANESDGTTVRPTFELGAKNNTIWLDQVEFRRFVPRDFDSDENLENGTILRPLRTQLSVYTDARGLDLMRFYSELDEKYFTGMRQYLKDTLGVKPLVAGTAPYWAYLGDIAIQSKLDIVDGHYYWDHPYWVGVPAWSATGWRIRNQPLINQLEDLANLASLAVEGKPFTVSEFNHVFPNRYAPEGPLLMALVASLQDWDAVYLFDYAGSTANFDDAFTTSYFSMSGNPVKSAQLPIASRIFQRGQSAPASERLAIELTGDEIAKGFAQGLASAPRFLEGKGLDRRAFMKTRLRITSFDRAAAVPINYTLPQGNVTSSNGELRWDVQDAKATFLRVAASGVQGAIGFLKGRTVDFGDWSAEFAGDAPDHMAVLLQARDDVPLRESRRMILSVWTEHQNTGMGWNADQTSVDNRWGSAPTVVKPASLKLSLRFPSVLLLRLFPLDEKGDRHEALSGEKSGATYRYTIDTGKDKTVWYEIEINDAASKADYAVPASDLFQLYTDPITAPLQAGWAEVVNSSGTAPQVLQLLEYYSRGILTSVVRIPATSAATLAVVPVVRDQQSNTALALLNRQGAPITVLLRLRDSLGSPADVVRSESLQPGETKAFFLHERLSVPSDFEGTLELSAPLPFHSFALRSTTNDSGDLIYTPYPTTATSAAGTSYFPHLVSDDSYSSEVLLWNPGSQSSRSRLEFFDSSGAAATRFAPADVLLEPGQFRRIVLARGSPSFSGYARLSLTGTAAPPVAVGVITRWEKRAPASEVGITASAPLDAATVGIPERYWQHGALALVNPDTTPASVDLEVSGTELLSTYRTKIELQANKKRALFLYEVFPNLPGTFTAILKIGSASKVIALPLLGINNSRGQFLMAALAEEPSALASSGNEATIPRFVAGEGYRMILFLLPSKSESASGSIQFRDSSGSPVPLFFR